MELTQRERDRIGDLVRTGKVNPMPDGPVVEDFDPFRIAEAIEQQAARASLLFDVPFVDLRMDVQNALKLAQFLKGIRG